jgi:hypothetical protein
MPERLKGHDWKSCVYSKRCTGGSNPPLSAKNKGSMDRDQRIFSDPYTLIPKILIAGSRATKDCEPRQIRKEATAAITDVCCG